MATTNAVSANESESRSKSLSWLLARKGKLAAHALKRYAAWVARPALFPAPTLAAEAVRYPFLLYDRSIAITREDAFADRLFAQGKRANLAIAAPSFDGLLLQAHRPLSFCRTLGRPSEARGYQIGMALNGGCVVPAIGGGLCLLSNALFKMAVQLGWTILERHGHSIDAGSVGMGSLWGLDATVFHPHVDLRVAPRRGSVRLEVRADDQVLNLRARGDRPPTQMVTLRSIDDRIEIAATEVIRHNRIERTIVEQASGAIVERRVVAVNRKRLLRSGEAGRSCLTCEARNCHARPGIADRPPR